MRVPLRIFGGLFSIALLALAALPWVHPSFTLTANNAYSPVEALTFSTLPPVNVGASRAILERSPFVKGRAAFDRETASTPPRPPAEVRLTGVSRLGDQLRANITIDGQFLAVRQGDETPVGVVSAIEETAITIIGAQTFHVELQSQ